MFISTKVTLIRILKMVTSIKTDQKVTLMMKMRGDNQTLNGAKIGDVRTEGWQSRPRRGARNSVLVGVLVTQTNKFILPSSYHDETATYFIKTP